MSNGAYTYIYTCRPLVMNVDVIDKSTIVPAATAATTAGVNVTGLAIRC